MLEQKDALRADGHRRRTETLIAAVVERIGGEFRAAKVFGDPVERDGVTVIPVASVRLGFGGGGGTDPQKRQDGEGAGGGGIMSAAGYIELKGGASRFVPAFRPERTIAMLLAALLVGVRIGARRRRHH
jgi:uncharacterized spore protein YtfJ